MSEQRDKADRLRSLHRPGDPVVFANVWDPASARIVETLGFEAVATTSAGVAFAQGFPDGEHIGLAGMLAAVERVCRATTVPVSADLEGAYGETVEHAVATAKGAIANGAVGLNFEDSRPGSDTLVDARLQARRIAAIRHTSEEYGVPLVINARTDFFLMEVGPESERMQAAIERGRLYREAGADCIFVPGITQLDAIAHLVREIGAPINVLTSPAAPSVAEMASAGVARLSYGSSTFLSTLTAFRDIVKQIREHGTFAAPADPVTYTQANALFT